MLDIELERYAKSDIYPFHMPGHKRTPLSADNPYTVDITEIDGFDDLYAPNGILKEAQERAAKLYGSKKSYYLVNGSTCGILAAVSAAVKPQGKLLMARNSHKSVYHAAYLRGLSTIYINPGITAFGIQGAVCPKDIEKKLAKNPGIGAVILTSPTYEGVVSDIKTISEIVHRYEIPLIVDEAHGAHFGFHKAFPETALHLGADIVVQSMHKVLPSLTQTALLHLNSKYVPEEDIEKYLAVYQTSSPSYVLMAGMERCIRLLSERGSELFCSYFSFLKEFYQKTNDFAKIHVMKRQDFTENEIFALDMSKILISVKNTNLTGKDLSKRLLDAYHLQMEMFSGFYVLGMTSIMDTKAGFFRLLKALEEIDGQIMFTEEKEDEKAALIHMLYAPKKKNLELYEAMGLPVTKIPLEKAEGKISGSMVSLYPPGIPILLPGEYIEADFIKNISKCIEMQLNLQGIADIVNKEINIVNF